MTLGEIDRWFALEIRRYNNSIHSSLGCSKAIGDSMPFLTCLRRGLQKNAI